MSTHPSLVMMGGGSWGAALADKLRQTDGQDCIILTRSADTATALRRGHIRQLRDIRLRAPLTATTDISCLTGADFIYLAVPISGHEDALALIDNHAAKNVPVILRKSYQDDIETISVCNSGSIFGVLDGEIMCNFD